MSQHAVLRTGYIAVIAVLILSAFEAWRIQNSLSAQNLIIYRHYAEQDRALRVLRLNLWQAGNYVRDFLIVSTPSQAAVLHTQLNDLRTEDDRALQLLDRDSGRVAAIPKLRRSLGEFWNVVAAVPQSMLNVSDESKLEFLQREIVPRRGELYNAMLDLAAADQQKLEEGERDFADARRRGGWRLITMLAVGVFLSVFVARASLKHAQTLESRAERHYHELQKLSARLLHVEEEGRRKLSRELHDEIGQALALLQIEISNALATPQPPGARRPLERARELAEQTVQTIRNMALLLRPTLLDDLGLVPALQFQLEDFLRRNPIACDFVEEGVADELPDPARTCAYRVIQEALHNCEKHSGATKVRVVVRQLPDALLAEVEDNGRGFSCDQGMPSRNNGLGLLGIRERAAIAGGTLVVDSAPGRGTRITLRIPLTEVPA
ncbi:MAG TPA: sensor histidine kinase [Bryobacteraceae bacterium]|nr:sensor histidine kinase [Bryobacteraceae bacterium]